MRKRRSGWAFALVLLATMLALTACSSSKSDGESMSEAADQMAMPAAGAEADLTNSNAGAASSPEEAADNKDDGGSAVVRSGGGIGPIADPTTGMNRKVIYKANVTLKVPEFGPADVKLRDAIHQSGSYILQFSNSMSSDEKGATYVIKVPAEGFSGFIDRLRLIQEDMQLQMEGSDVTEEYVDLEARLQAKETVEARLLSFLEKATKSDDLVRFSNELAGVQEQIEQIKGRMRFLDQNVAFSTVHVRLYESSVTIEALEEKEDGFGTRIVQTMTDSAKVMGEIGRALVLFLAGLLPVAAVAAVVGVPIWLIVHGRRKNRHENATSRRKEWNNRSERNEMTATKPENSKQDEGSALEPQGISDSSKTDDELR